MDMFFTVLLGISFILIPFSIGGLIYSFIKKRPKIKWIIMIIFSLLFPLLLIFTFDKYLDISPPTLTEIENTSNNDKPGTVRLQEGKYIVGEDINSGIYDLEFQKDSGAFNIESLDYNLNFGDMMLGDTTKSRVYLIDGQGIDITLGVGIFVPANEVLHPYEEVELYSGVWYVGKSITPGRYRIEPVKYSGNLFIDSKDGALIAHEIGDRIITVTLNEGDKIKIKGTKFKFIPSKN